MVHLLRSRNCKPTWTYGCAARLFRSSAAGRCVSFARKAVAGFFRSALALRHARLSAPAHLCQTCGSTAARGIRAGQPDEGVRMYYRCAVLDDYQNVALKSADWAQITADV